MTREIVRCREPLRLPLEPASSFSSSPSSPSPTRELDGAPTIPPELWVDILSYLSPPEAWRARWVCTQIRDIVDNHFAKRWLKSVTFQAFEWRKRPNTSMLDKRSYRDLYWDSYITRMWVYTQDERFVHVQLPSLPQDDADRLVRAKQQPVFGFFYDVLLFLRLCARNSLYNFWMPPWVKLIEGATLNLSFRSTLCGRGPDPIPWITLYSAEAPIVKAGRMLPGFQVRYDVENGPRVLLLDRSVLLGTMFNHPGNLDDCWYCDQWGTLRYRGQGYPY